MSKIIRNVFISGTGSYVPETVYTNDYLASKVDTNDAWIKETLGISKRHIASVDQYTSDLATISAKRALADAQLSPFDIDLELYQSYLPHQQKAQPK